MFNVPYGVGVFDLETRVHPIEVNLQHLTREEHFHTTIFRVQHRVAKKVITLLVTFDSVCMSDGIFWSNGVPDAIFNPVIKHVEQRIMGDCYPANKGYYSIGLLVDYGVVYADVLADYLQPDYLPFINDDYLNYGVLD